MAGPARPPLTSGAGELRAVDPGPLFGVGTRRIERLAGRMADVEALRARLARHARSGVTGRVTTERLALRWALVGILLASRAASAASGGVETAYGIATVGGV